MLNRNTENMINSILSPNTLNEEFAAPVSPAVPVAGAPVPETVAPPPIEPEAKRLPKEQLKSNTPINELADLSLQDMIDSKEDLLDDPEPIKELLKDLDEAEVSELKKQLVLLLRDGSGNKLSEEAKEAKKLLLELVKNRISELIGGSTPTLAPVAGAPVPETAAPPPIEPETIPEVPKYIAPSISSDFLIGITQMSPDDFTKAKIRGTQAEIMEIISSLKEPQEKKQLEEKLEELKKVIPTELIPHYIIDSWRDSIEQVATEETTGA